MADHFLLVVGRDWRLRRLIRANLEVLGFQVREAADGQQGVALLRDSRPRLILLDLDLLDEEDRQVLADLCDAMPRQPVPVIVLGSELPGRDVLQREGVAGYLKKPFAIPALLEQVQQLLEYP